MSGCAEGWSDRRGCQHQGEVEADDLLWRLLKGSSQEKKTIEITDSMRGTFTTLFFSETQLKDVITVTFSISS